MRLLRVITLVALANRACGFNLFGGSPLTPSSSSEFEQTTISPSTSSSLQNKPELYNKAMLEIKRLEEEPLCHRIAAQLLMNTCRGLQNVNEENLQFTKSRLQRNHVESFAAALTICDMEDVKMPVPESCRPLSSSALFQAVRDNKDSLVVPSDVVGACLTSLSEQEKPWMTWLSRRDTALLFCRASSIDMDNDQLFQSHKKLVQIMAGFSSDLDQELKAMMENMDSHAREADSYFAGFKSQMERMTTNVKSSFESVSVDIKDVASSIKSMKQSGVDMQQFMQTLFKTAVDGNAEMAATHEQALSLSTNNIQARFEDLNGLAEKNQAYTIHMASFMHDLVARIEAASEQHDTMHKNAQQMVHILTNATELFVVHADKIEQASLTVARIHDNLGPVAAAGDIVTGIIKYGRSCGNSAIDWAIRGATPPSIMVLGTYGLPAFPLRKVLLVVAGVGGIPVGDRLVRLRHLDLDWSMEWCSEYFKSFTSPSLERQHARQSKFDMPVENPLSSAIDDWTPEDIHSEMH